MIDVAILVPFESEEVTWIDPVVRRAWSPAVYKSVEARQRLEEFVGRPLRTKGDMPALHSLGNTAFRSLSAVTLATAVDRAGLTWTAIDPGLVSLSQWRTHLAKLRAQRPRVVAITTTFIQTPAYATAICAMVRRELPGAIVALGGYLYATDARRFLELNADVYCVGEGERRIVDVARAARDERPLDAVAGLYLRRGDELRSTGVAEPLPFDELPLPDWKLAERIVPTVKLDEDWILYHVETQRGCRFKCEFCTFRVVSAPAEQSAEHAVSAILNAARHGDGMIWVVDPTATYPRNRWRAILQGLIDHGSRTPIKVFARVTDLDDEICAMMAKARVVQALVGQESGSQRILNAMRKGTRVEHVGPAVDAMARHGIIADFAFIHGFPGEDAESLRETRAMMTSLNARCPEAPCAVIAELEVFQVQDLANVSSREALKDSTHLFDYRGLSMSARTASEEMLASYVALSRVPHAPVTGCGVSRTLLGSLIRSTQTARRAEHFRWAKAFDRGIAMFVEHDLDGKPIDLAELRRVRDTINSAYPPIEMRERLWHRTVRRARHTIARRLIAEWQHEDASGVGPLTRMLLGYSAYAVSGDVRDAIRAISRGACLPFPQGEHTTTHPASTHASQELIRLARNAANAPTRRKPPTAPASG